jgi:flagellar basal body-associated protein FliL
VWRRKGGDKRGKCGVFIILVVVVVVVAAAVALC